MPNLMERFRRALGYEISAVSEHAKVDKRLQEQQLRINAIDAAIAAQNAAPRKERRRASRP